MNYKIITDEKILVDFIDNFLPELKTNECYYFCLFARSKYAKNEDGSNKFPHIKTDKSQLKRFVATNKTNILTKIKQLEVPVGAYKTKDSDDIPQEALALYVNPGPRNQKKAMFTLMKKFIEIQEGSAENFNINAEALSAIQKSRSKKTFVGFDIDGEDASNEVFEKMKYDYINKEAVHFLKTRGGMHIIVDVSKIEKQFEHKWYHFFANTFAIDVKGDNMIPVPGTYQGGFTPRFIELGSELVFSKEKLKELWVDLEPTMELQGGAGLLERLDKELRDLCTGKNDELMQYLKMSRPIKNGPGLLDFMQEARPVPPTTSEMPMPKIGDEIYVPSSCYLSRGRDDFDGGLAIINKIQFRKHLPEDSINCIMVGIEGQPGVLHNYKMLLSKQDKLREQYAGRIAKPNPDLRPEFNTGW